MTAHTPGPWSLVRSFKNWQMPLQIEAEDGTCIVALEPHPLHDMEANARLIAAAPTMYDFVKQSADSGDARAKVILEAIHGRG